MIPDIEPRLQETLRIRATRNGRSVEAEAREIVRTALADEAVGEDEVGLGTAIRRRFVPYGGVELDARDPATRREPPTFE